MSNGKRDNPNNILASRFPPKNLKLMKKKKRVPWLGDSVGWSITPCTGRLWVPSLSGNIPRLQVLSPVGVLKGGNR